MKRIPVPGIPDVCRSECAEYEIYIGAKKRCYNPAHASYYLYGGRGIVMCKRWKDDFDAFIVDMGPRTSDKHSLDRKDPNGHYSCGKCDGCKIQSWPSNCRWATSSEQNNNRRDNRFIEYGGKRLTMAQWDRELGFPDNLVKKRLLRGWPIEDIMRIPARQCRGQSTQVTINSETHSTLQWCIILGLSPVTVNRRIQNGMTPVDALTIPIKKKYSHQKLLGKPKINPCPRCKLEQQHPVLKLPLSFRGAP